MLEILIFGCGAFVGFVVAVVIGTIISGKDLREEPDWWERM